MDCADRIAVLASERTLEPVRALGEPGAPAAVTVRARLERRRLDVTVRRVEGERPAAYWWEIREVGPDGRAKPGGLELRCPPSSDEAARDPEDAYWFALEAVRAGLAAVSA